MVKGTSSYEWLKIRDMAKRMATKGTKKDPYKGLESKGHVISENARDLRNALERIGYNIADAGAFMKEYDPQVVAVGEMEGYDISPLYGGIFKLGIMKGDKDWAMKGSSLYNVSDLEYYRKLRQVSLSRDRIDVMNRTVRESAESAFMAWQDAFRNSRKAGDVTEYEEGPGVDRLQKNLEVASEAYLSQQQAKVDGRLLPSVKKYAFSGKVLLVTPTEDLFFPSFKKGLERERLGYLIAVRKA